ncbi:MAG: SCP2 sterol-binding domain-containing protein, partial [Deltaproteobacteria bacterium]|nr:SCP2 sterol-binding domain-containing protein [Deltaproteobacteria bacterium]
GKLRPESALLTGKIKMSGDIGLAMKLGQLLRK